MIRNRFGFYPVLVTVIAGVAFTACAKKEDLHTSPISNPNALVDPLWKLRITAECGADSATSPDQCRSGYGFSVAADGHYQVGPGPQGQFYAGRLRNTEIEALTAKVNQLIDTVSATTLFEGTETCSVREKPEALADVHHLEFNLRGRQKQLAKVDKTRFCVTAQKEEIEPIYAEIKELARIYYPLPFPDECTQAALAVQELYAPLTTCRTDADCTYVDNTFEAVRDSDLQFVVTDDCSVIPPLVVANTSRLSGTQSRLLAAREQARAVCGDRVFRINCEAISGFQSDDPAPVCRQGVCRMNPHVVID